MRRAVAIVVMALAVAAHPGCKDTLSGPSPAIGSEFSLAPAARARIAGTPISVRFDRVDGDSRCPADVDCVHGGDAVVRVTVQDSGTDHRYELHTGDAQPVTHRQWTIVLLELSPHPTSARTIAPDEYRATFRVR